MNLRYHSGGCCGIKILCDFPWFGDADSSVEASNRISEELDRDLEAYFHSGTQFQAEPYPVESVKDRLYRLLRFINWARPGTLVQAVLSSGMSDFGGLAELLTGAGFREVDSFENSNSEHTCHIYHYKVPPCED